VTTLAWAYLLLAGLFEIGFTTSMQFIKGAKSWWPYAAFVVCIALSFIFLAQAIGSIPVGTAYAVWTGIGAAGTAILGILLFGEPATAGRVVFLAGLIVSLVGLKLVSPS
jgi:quaternary ammonium compound-resistance protein SugE